MKCKGCEIACPFAIPAQCPIRALLEDRIEQMTRGLEQVNKELEGTILVMSTTSFGRN